MTELHLGEGKAALVFGECKDCHEPIDACVCPSAKAAIADYKKHKLLTTEQAAKSIREQFGKHLNVLGY